MGALEVGLSYLPTPITIGVFALVVSSRLSVRLGAKTTLLTGLALFTAGFALLARLPLGAAYITDILPAFLLLGAGFGLANPALTTLAMSGTATEDAGLASGLINTTQEVGAALGVAVLATLASQTSEGLLTTGSSSTIALSAGYRLAFTVACGLAATAFTLAATLLRPNQR